MIRLTNCLECGGTLESATITWPTVIKHPVIEKVEGVPILKCSVCGIEYVTETTTNAILAKHKEKQAQ
jgi:YgiT-type zinc finger domain-containing protein